MVATETIRAGALGRASPKQAKKDETLGLAGTEGFEGSERVDTPNSTDATSERKAVGTLIARAAQAGFELVPLTAGAWEARRWGLAKPLAKIADVEAWLERVAGGAR